MILDVIVIKRADGFTAEIPSLSGCESWDHSEEGVLEKIIELASYYMRVEVDKFKVDKARGGKEKTIYKLVFEKGTG
jgi:hypothetical protein